MTIPKRRANDQEECTFKGGAEGEKRRRRKPETRNEVTAPGGMNNARGSPFMSSSIIVFFFFFSSGLKRAERTRLDLVRGGALGAPASMYPKSNSRPIRGCAVRHSNQHCSQSQESAGDGGGAGPNSSPESVLIGQSCQIRNPAAHHVWLWVGR